MGLLDTALFLLVLSFAGTQSRAAPVADDLTSPDRALVARIDAIAEIHRRLFSAASIELRLPVAVAPASQRQWTSAELMTGLDGPAWNAETKAAIRALLDEAVIEVKAGYFNLDATGRWYVANQPRALRAMASSGDILGYWEHESTTGQNGARNYVRRRAAEVERQAGQSPEDRRSVWGQSLQRISFRNDQPAEQDRLLIERLTRRQMNAGMSEPPLTTQERADIDRLGLSMDKPAVLRRYQEASVGANRQLLSDMSRDNVLRIIRSPLRRPPSPQAMALLWQELRRVSFDLAEALDPTQQESIRTLRFVEKLPSGRKPDLFAPTLWFGASIEEGSGQIVLGGTGEAVYAGFAVCSLSSATAMRWDAYGLLKNEGRPVRPRIDIRPWDVPEMENLSAPDPIFRLQQLLGRDDPMPKYYITIDDARYATRGVIRGFDNCLTRYFAFVMAHEQAHLYLRNEDGLAADEFLVDCAAMKHLRAYAERFKGGLDLPSEGFMRHLLDASQALQASLVDTGFQHEEFKQRYGAMREGRCLRAPATAPLAESRSRN